MDTSLVVIGLGNPGARYSKTRHNLGFWVVDMLAGRHKSRWRQPSALYRESHVRIGGKTVLLVAPLTYMNLSGDAVAALSQVASLAPSDLLVICDDFALQLGRLRLRKKGSDGGHNGLKSIMEQLGTSSYPRLRLGVGPLPEDSDQADFVLTGFSAREKRIAEQMANRAADCVETRLLAGFAEAMNLYNTRENGKEPD